MKQLAVEHKCSACDGTGFSAATNPMQPGRRIHPAPCKEYGGEGRTRETASSRPEPDSPMSLPMASTRGAGTCV
jgi:DnaJ-class molecular chaperone